MDIKNIVVLSGGISNEREISRMTADQIASALQSRGHHVTKVDVNEQSVRSGELIHDPSIVGADVVFIALHGKYGEDGLIQALLEMIGKPYTGSGVLTSAFAMDKAWTQEKVSRHGLRVPKNFVLHSLKDVDKLTDRSSEMIFYPCVVKPNASGSSIGISIVRKAEQLSNAIQRAFKEDTAVIIEEYIRGREFTCGVIGNSHQTSLDVLPVVEIIPSREFFDYDAKYFDSSTQEICPANIPSELSHTIQQQARTVHLVLGCRGLSRSDFILSENSVLYFLEINTIPGQTEASLAPKEARALGMSFPDFLERQVELAIQ